MLSGFLLATFFYHQRSESVLFHVYYLNTIKIKSPSLNIIGESYKEFLIRKAQMLSFGCKLLWNLRKRDYEDGQLFTASIICSSLLVTVPQLPSEPPVPRQLPHSGEVLAADWSVSMCPRSHAIRGFPWVIAAEKGKEPHQRWWESRRLLLGLGLVSGRLFLSLWPLPRAPWLPLTRQSPSITTWAF